MTDETSAPRVHFVSLGCPKNRVDSELMLGQLAARQFEVVADAEGADVVVVNTCGFIESAKEESVETIMEMARHRTHGDVKKLIVTGCLVQRYADELREGIPEIDHLIGNGGYQEVAEAALNGLDNDIALPDMTFIHDATSPRLNTFMPHTAYVKVSEGCDQKCAFCIIPKLRGTQRSRTVEDIKLEAETLAARGVVELNLVAQDLTGYGYDLNPRRSLADILRALGQVDQLSWVRMHYAYPRHFSKDLLDAMAEESKVVPYLDMPLQHISDSVLKRMNRGKPRAFIERLLDKVRNRIPNLTFRTSFIVGFPGETEADFQELCDWIEEQPLDRVGVFPFSREEGTTSYDLPNQVPAEVIEARRVELMERLRLKSQQRLLGFLDKKIEVLVDRVSPETELLLEGRHAGQAPEVDGVVYINDGWAQPGDLVEVEITETYDHDLCGHIVREIKKAPVRPQHAQMGAPSKLRVLN